jgi:hypothetical protein
LGEDYSSNSTNATDNNANYVQATKFTSNTTGTVSSLNVAFDTRVGVGSTFSVALFADSAGSPGTLLGKHTGSATVTTPSPGSINWNTLSLDSSVNVTAGTTYWLAFQTNDISTFKRIIVAGSSAYRNGTCTVGTWGTSWSGASPTCTTSQGTSTDELGIYATVSSGGLTDTFNNPLVSVSTSGATTLRNLANSQTAFQVQNASGVNLIQADTSNGKVVIGSNGGSGASSTIEIADSSNPTINQQVIIGSTANQGNNKTTIQGGDATGTSTSGAIILQVASGAAINIGNTASSKIINIGSTVALAGDSTINIGTSSANTQTVTIGSTNGSSATTIQGGSGNINLISNQAGAGTIVKSVTNNSNAAFQIQDASAGEDHLSQIEHRVLKSQTSQWRTDMRARLYLLSLFSFSLLSFPDRRT